MVNEHKKIFENSRHDNRSSLGEKKPNQLCQALNNVLFILLFEDSVDQRVVVSFQQLERAQRFSNFVSVQFVDEEKQELASYSRYEILHRNDLVCSKTSFLPYEMLELKIEIVLHRKCNMPRLSGGNLVVLESICSNTKGNPQSCSKSCH